MRAVDTWICGLLIAFSGCILCSESANAVSHYDSRLYIGAHGGVNMSMVTFTPSVSQNFIFGGNAGLNFRYIEEKHFGFIFELNFEQRGWDEDFEEYKYRYSRTLNYVQIPFLAHIYFGKRAKFYVNAGPSVSFFISDKIKSNFDYQNASSLPGMSSHITYQYLKPTHQKVDYGISAGIGGEYSVNKRNSLYLDARFYYGLGDVLKSGRTENIRGSNSMSISVSLGYWFRFK